MATAAAGGRGSRCGDGGEFPASVEPSLSASGLPGVGVLAGADAPGRLIAAREQNPIDLARELCIVDSDWTRWPVVAVRSARSPVEASVCADGRPLDPPLRAGDILSPAVLEGHVVRPALWGACVAQLQGNVPLGVRSFVLACTWKAFEEQQVEAAHLRVEVGVHRRGAGACAAARVVEKQILPSEDGERPRYVQMTVIKNGRSVTMRRRAKPGELREAEEEAEAVGDAKPKRTTAPDVLAAATVSDT